MTNNIWWILLGMGAVTQVIKLILLIPQQPPRLPARLQQALRVAPACALLSIIALDAARWANGVWLSWQNPKVIAVLVALAFFHFTRKPMLTIALGIFTLIALRFLYEI
jgi:branched-subunit amino acid transport protein